MGAPLLEVDVTNEEEGLEEDKVLKKKKQLLVLTVND